jgi:two-component system, NtrC family, sensor kinase
MNSFCRIHPHHQPPMRSEPSAAPAELTHAAGGHSTYAPPEQADSLLKIFIEHTPLAVIHWDRDLDVIEWNPAAEQMFGYTRQEALGRHLTDFLLQPANVAEIQQCFVGLLNQQMGDRGVSRNICKDGTIITCEWTNTPLVLDGRVVGIISMAQDVSDRDRVETAEAALRESEQRLRSVISAAPMILYAINREGYFTFSDGRGLETLGLKPGQVVGQSVFELYQQLPETLDNIRRSLKGETLRFLSSVGHTHFETLHTPFYDDWGNLLGTIGVAFDISDRIKTEAALKASEERFHRIAANIPGMIYRNVSHPDNSNEFLYISPRCQDIFEQPPEVFLNDAVLLWQMTLDEDVPLLYRAMGEAIQTGMAKPVDFRIATPSGCIKWLQLTATTSPQANGDIFWDGLILEITAQKTVQDAFERTAQKLQNAQRIAHIGSWDYDVMNNILTCSDEMLRIYGISQENGHKNPNQENQETSLSANMSSHMGLEQFQRFYPEAEWDYMMMLMQRAILHGEPYNTELAIVRADGESGYVHLRTEVEQNAMGQVTWLFGTVVDIRDRKETEEQLRDYAERQALLNRLADQIRNTLDLDTVISTAVSASRELTETDCAYFGWLHQDNDPPLLEFIQQASRGEVPNFIGTYPAIASDVIQTIIEQRAVCIHDAKQFSDPIYAEFLNSVGIQSQIVVPIHTNMGQIGLFVCSHLQRTHRWTRDEVDILMAVADQLAIAIDQAALFAQTAAKSQELEAALKEVQRTQAQMVQSEKMSSLGQLVAGVAHEINNPVSFIYGNINHAQSYVDDLLNLIRLYQAEHTNPSAALLEEIETIDLDFLQTDLPKILSSMKMGADRIKQIVLSLRTFSRMDEAEIKAVDLHEGIDSSLMILEHRLKPQPNRPAITVVREYGTLPQIECYAGQMNQVFMNLLSNAIDALEEAWAMGHWSAQQSPAEASPHGDSPTIRIATCTEGDRLIICIADNGVGIPESVQSRLFDPFFTTKPVGKGTGMGLSISYQIITEKHGGILKCQSAPGQGAEFTIELTRKIALYS